MRTVTLGRSELEVTPICFGCWQMGQTFWGRQPEETLAEAVHVAVDLGINFFDTADAYGDGESERILGRALKGIRRQNVVVATKVYHHFYPDGHRHPDLSKAYILAECDASLQRLGLDYLDLYQCHSFDAYTPLAETADAMETLKRLGKVRAYGVSNFEIEHLRLARRHGAFDTLQPYYNLIDREMEDDLLPYCQNEDLGVLVYSPLLRGLLCGKFKGDEKFDDLRGKDERFKGDAFKALIAKVEKLRPMAAKRGCTITQLSLAATIANPGIHCAIVGIKNADQVRDVAGAADIQLTREEYHAVRGALA